MRRTILGVAATLSCAAVAQQSRPGSLADLGIRVVEPLSGKKLAAARAKVDTALHHAAAAAWFENATDATGGKARHRPSGLICPLGGKGQRVVIATQDRAGCEVENGRTLYRTDVARAPAGSSLDAAAVLALAAAQSEPGYTCLGGPSVRAHPRAGSGRPESRTFRFRSLMGGRERFSRVQVGIVRDWVLTERRIDVQPPAPSPGIGDLLEEVTFGSKMMR